ncbi:spore gernimation protein GerE [Salmonella enterica]|nr:spore gernimation protein GerE [Salmonella enterica subsp. arizonae serovar 63:g,z51:-]EAZ2931596.1 spore gernimation protein GerE [Salmonella enterica]EBM6935906.1 spore gernimation protein GerE [Salmonella enterica]ECC0988160.1 spore gernimation protein GerE [Salmonella enterica]ECE1694681.1 spore gernimation protein GerE [Salmonella enterica]
MRYIAMQYKNKLKHIDIKNGILLLAEKFNLTLSEKKVIYYIAAGLSVKSCSNLLDRNIKTISTQKRSAYRKMAITTDVELIHLMLTEFSISIEIT